MKIVIDIPEEEYEQIVNLDLSGDNTLYHAVKNGTPLLKGHGDLVDRNSLDFTDIDFYVPHCVYDVQNVVDNAPTVIEGSESE